MRTRIWHSDWKPRWLIRCVSAALLSFVDKQEEIWLQGPESSCARRLSYRRCKTGEAVDLPILPELARELVLLPTTQMVLLARNDGVKGYAVESFGILFRRWCNEAGLPGCSAHGLRKAGARRLAEAGATEFEVMSFLGHATAKEASRYVAAANRASLANSGMAKLGAKPEQRLSNLSARLDNWGS